MAFEQSLWSRAERAFGRASAAMLQGSFADAITHLDEALEYSPNDIKSLALRASAKRSMVRVQTMHDARSARARFASRARSARAHTLPHAQCA